MCKVDIKNGDTRIDPCMRTLIKELNGIKQNHFEILACCCGHGKYPMTIVVRNKTCPLQVQHRIINCTWDLISGVEILRQRRFYKRDKTGRYYIPECVLESNSVKEKE